MQTDTDQREAQADDESLGTRSEVEDLGACKRKVTASVPAEKVREEVDRSYKELTKMVQLPGFRRGRVPRRLLEARFGEEVESDLKESLVQASFAEVVEEKGLRLVGAPRFDNVKFQPEADFEYEAEVEVRPEFELGEYKGIEVQRDEKPVSEEAVSEQLESLRKRTAKRVPLEPSEAGDDDLFFGTYDLFREEAKVKSEQKAHFRPASKVIDGFLVEDLGEKMSAWDRSGDDALVLDVKVPATYADEVLRGTDVRLEFKLQEISRNELPEMNDEWAKEFGEDTLDALKKSIQESLQEDTVRTAHKEVEDKVLESLAAATQMQLPETLLETQRQRMHAEREQELLQQGMTPEEVKEKLATEGDKVTEDLERELKKVFLLGEIADKEKIFATESDVSERLTRMAMLYGLPPEALREELKKSGRLEEIRTAVRHEKTRAWLRKKARIEEIGVQPEKEKNDSSSPEESPKSEEEADAETAGSEESHET